MKLRNDQFYRVDKGQEHRRTLSRAAIFCLVTLAAIFLSTRSSSASASYVYITQSGSASGSCTTGVQSVSWLNNPANWGSGSAQVGPGTVVLLCGTITTSIQVNGSGTNGSVIEFLADTGANVVIPGSAGSCPIVLNNNNYLLFDGGGAGGTNGIIQVTGNGSGLATQNLVSAFCGATSDGNIEIRNWLIENMYQHTSLSDATNSADTETNVFASPNGLSGPLSIHDNVIHDVGVAILIEGVLANSPVISIYNNYIYNIDWALGMAPTAGVHSLLFYNNHIGSATNWDTTGDYFHHDGIHFFEGAGPSSTGTYIYNNLWDGNWGSCCSTAFIYQEYAPIAKLYIYNNVFNEYAGNQMPLVQIQATTGSFYNNTLQCAAGGSNNSGLTIEYPSTNFNVENNAFQGCNTFLNYQTSYGPSGGGIVDHNVYMVQGPGGNNPFSGGANLANWQSGCSCDAHSVFSVSTNYLNSNGSPMSTFPGLSTGANPGTSLTSIATGNLTALDYDTSAGSTHTPAVRSVPWVVGAYTVSGSSSSQPAAPIGLSATVN